MTSQTARSVPNRLHRCKPASQTLTAPKRSCTRSYKVGFKTVISAIELAPLSGRRGLVPHPPPPGLSTRLVVHPQALHGVGLGAVANVLLLADFDQTPV